VIGTRGRDQVAQHRIFGQDGLVSAWPSRLGWLKARENSHRSPTRRAYCSSRRSDAFEIENPPRISPKQGARPVPSNRHLDHHSLQNSPMTRQLLQKTTPYVPAY
jgi:hypothetical protein